ncbi:MAG: FAD-binding protein [SAR202 cluster bacterium]|nr:FAD-binding protein [SAR202 cluster bacterium]
MPILYDSVKRAAALGEREIAGIAEWLKQRIAGEVKFDTYTRLLYGTDASIYQMMPVGVTFPMSADDVEAIIKTAKEHGVPVLPRGGGTGLSGQTCNHAIVMDFSRHMNKVIEVQPEERWVRTQPGIIVSNLNRAVAGHGLTYGPDPTTINRATVGGGIGNNSCGAHSVIYGKTLDHVLDVDAVLSDGSRATFAPKGGAALESLMLDSSLEGRLYREVRRIAHENRDEIARRFPKILRRVAGYNIDDFTGTAPMNLARLAVGSEGTLVTVTEARLNLVPLPRKKGLAVVHFHGLVEAMEATVAILDHGPSAVEHVGDLIINNCRVNPGFRHLVSYLEGEPENLLFVEFYGDTEVEIEGKLQALKADLGRRRLGYATLHTTDPAKQRLWYSLREAGLGLAMALKGDAKPFPYVEDTAVSPEKLPQYVARFDEIVRKYDTQAAYYGHASTGCMHIRPVVSLKSDAGLDKLEGIAREVSDLVLEFGGSLTGEHGDGIVRGVFTKKMFGEQIYEAFKELKVAFDPEGVMNPGKIIETPAIRENLRMSPQTRYLPIETHQDFSREGGFAAAIEACNGQGACRKSEGGMCPSFMVTRDEEHSTRGRANLLRMVMHGILPADQLRSDRLKQALDLCVECKACKVECPSNVDMAKLKVEVLAKYYEGRPIPLRERLFGDVARFNRLGSRVAPVANALGGVKPLRALGERVAGIHRDRPLPHFAPQRFTTWFRRRKAPPATGREVVYFNDTFTEYWYPEVGIATVRVLEAMGFTVTVVEKQECCLHPMISKGQLAKVKERAPKGVAALLPHARRGVPIVGAEASCMLTLRQDYPDILRDEASRALARQVFTLEEFLAKVARGTPDAARVFRDDLRRDIQVHVHCQQKADTGTALTLAALRMVPGYNAELIDSGCCGMAGTFGFEREHYDVSKAMGSLKLFPAVEAEEKRGWDVAMTGVSCRQQIGHFTSKRPRHVVEYLADALK